eukprot:Lithocolla_globosa_v1_NODE_191_length_5320_cov_8.118139.p6 type:complete len:109 gc:universal NODE_191_length_5320_cov_8.118139:2189-2515(+)
MVTHRSSDWGPTGSAAFHPHHELILTTTPRKGCSKAGCQGPETSHPSPRFHGRCEPPMPHSQKTQGSGQHLRHLPRLDQMSQIGGRQIRNPRIGEWEKGGSRLEGRSA